MDDAMRLPDMMLTHGLVSGQTFPFKPGKRYRVKRTGRFCTYLGPHRLSRCGSWSGKVRINYVDTQRVGVVKPSSLEEFRHAN